MTDAILQRCNKLKSRINEIDKLLKEINNVNTMTGEETTLPICIQAGIQNPVEFYMGEEFSDPSLYDLDKAMYEQITSLLTAYRDHIHKVFEGIRDY